MMVLRRLWDEIRCDARYGSRMLRKDPLLTVVAVASMALGIGANTALFSVAKTVLFDALGVAHPEELRVLRWQFAGPHQPVESIYGDTSFNSAGHFTSTSFSYPVYRQLDSSKEFFDGIAAFYHTDRLTAVIDGVADSVTAEAVSGNFFQVLGASTLIGRPIVPEDARDNAPAVAVLSYELWASRFAQSPAVVGKTITLNSVPVTIIGVTRSAFSGPQEGSAGRVFFPATLKSRVDPSSFDPDQAHNGRSWWVRLLGRLKPGVSDTRAQAALNARFQQAAQSTLANRAHADLSQLTLAVEPASQAEALLRNHLAGPVSILFALVTLLLLLACTNVANLLVAKSTARTREMNVRKALGASRWRIVRQMLTESLLLALLAGVAGLLLAYELGRALPHFLDLPQAPVFDGPVFAFTISLTVCTGLLFGLAPALQIFREQPALSINESSRITGDRSKARLRQSLVVFEIALSTVLLIGALLFLRTLTNLLRVPLGFQPSKLLLFEVRPPQDRYSGSAQRVALFENLEQRFATLPGVRSAALVNDVLISGSVDGQNFDPNDRPRRDGNQALKNSVSSSFFQTAGIPILRGRSFDANDTANSRKVAVINEQLARVYFPHQDAIGKTFNGDQILIVGVAGDARYASVRDAPAPTFYQPYMQTDKLDGETFYLKTRSDPMQLASAVRKAVAGIDPELPVLNFRTQEDEIHLSLSHERLFAALTSSFGVLALFLATIGVYGVMSYSVARRTNEVGIRLALGAQGSQILRLMMTEGLLLALAGCAAGLGAALYLTRYIRAQFYAVAPEDPFILLAAGLLLVGSAALAVWLPARRAARISPTEALRHQ